MDFCLNQSSTESSVEEISKCKDQSDEYRVERKSIERQFFVAETSSVTNFVDEVNPNIALFYYQL